MEERDDSVQHLDPISGNNIRESATIKRDVNITDGKPKDLVQDSTISQVFKSDNKNLQFIASGIYKAGINVSKQLRICLNKNIRADDKIALVEPIQNFLSTFSDFCMGFNTPKGKADKKDKLYKRAVEGGYRLQICLRVLFDSGYLKESFYCSLSVNLTDYISQLESLVRKRKDS